MRLLFIVDSPSTLDPKKDSTIALMRAATLANFEVYSTTIFDLFIDGNRLLFNVDLLSVSTNDEKWISDRKPLTVYGNDFDLIFMRKEPPVDSAFITATHLLDYLSPKTPVVNTPSSLRTINEKLAILNFEELILPTWVGCHIDQATTFHQHHQSIVIKPLDGMGGQGIYISLANDLNFRSIFELLTHQGTRHVMLQKFSTAADDGDYRLFVVNGKPLPWSLKRIHADNDYRNNIAAGGQAIAKPLANNHRALANFVGPYLKANRIAFAGLDVIGNHLIEINITCPTGLRQVSDQTKENIAHTVLIDIINQYHLKSPI